VSQRAQADRERFAPFSVSLHPMVQGKLVIAVATYMRPVDIDRCVRSVLTEREQYRQEHEAYDIRIVVIDNDPEASARDTVAQYVGPEVTYLIEAQPGISAARNRALAEAGAADLLIFIDDDEEIVPGWLGHLLGTFETWEPAAVAGRVVSAYLHEPDPWFAAGGFFSRRTLPTGTPIVAAATNNLLLDLRVIRALDLSFDDFYGLIGGGDNHFTRRLTQLGQKMVWCDEAVVIDHVPASRLTRDWVLARACRTGNSEVVVGLRLATSGPERLRRRLEAAGRGVMRVVLGAAAMAAGGLTGSLRWQARGAKAFNRGRGMLMGARGSTVAEYERVASKSSFAPLRVLASFGEPRATTNPYITQLARELDQTPGVDLIRFGWVRAVIGRYDVVHMHWPEILLRSPSQPKRYGRRLAFGTLLLRWRVFGTPVVRTLHNTKPHEDVTSLDRRLLGLLDALTVHRIALNPTDVRDATTSMIAHGHYEDVFSPASVPDPERGRIVFAGHIREYKNVPAAMNTFRGLASLDARFRVVGQASSEALAATIRDAAASDERISVDLRYLGDEELAVEIGRAQLVVLPYVEMHNSGAVLLALSLRRPVLVPDNDVTQLLAEEVGAAWVQRYRGELKANDLGRALGATENLPREGPDLSARSWGKVGAAHEQVYRTATSHRRARLRV
jgi:GT2 family glycosyltransferase